MEGKKRGSDGPVPANAKRNKFNHSTTSAILTNLSEVGHALNLPPPCMDIAASYLQDFLRFTADCQEQELANTPQNQWAWIASSIFVAVYVAETAPPSPVSLSQLLTLTNHTTVKTFVKQMYHMVLLSLLLLVMFSLLLDAVLSVALAV